MTGHTPSAPLEDWMRDPQAVRGDSPDPRTAVATAARRTPTSNLDPRALVRAALAGGTIVDGLEFQIQAMLTKSDASGLYAEDFIEQMATCPESFVFDTIEKFRGAFPKDFRIREFKRRIMAARIKLDAALRAEGAADWKGQLLRNENGAPKPLLANAIACLRHAPTWEGVHALDEFAVRTVTLKPTPWNSDPHAWSDTEDILLAEWLQHEGILISRELAGQAVEAVSRERSFHPVKQYLGGLRWDGKPRLSRWLQTYLGADPEEQGAGPDKQAGEAYLAAIGARWMISAAARVMRPGCKADCCLILEGPQGAKKSTALRTLAGPWFADEISDLGSKDSAMQTRGVWILELAELDALTRPEASKVKAFMSRATDHFRPPYGRRVIDLPRQCVFAGSVNHSNYLKDETGARRFWPVKCGSIDVEALARDRDQLWAETLVRFQDGDPWWLETPELAEQARAVAADRYDADVWDSLVLEWADGRIASGMDSVSVPEILQSCLQKNPGQWTRADEMRVARGLRSGDWERYRDRRRDMEWRYRRVERRPSVPDASIPNR